MSEKSLTICIWICCIIFRVCVNVRCDNETGENNTWREWNFSPPHSKCVHRRIENQSSLTNISQNNHCDYGPKSSTPPSWLQHQLIKMYSDDEIYWEVTTPRENFTLTLLAKPHVEDKKECACDPKDDLNLLQYMPNEKDSSRSITKNMSAYGTFIKIFTGCYYFVMTNEEKKSWLWGPYFYNTMYRVYDTTLKCHFENVSETNSIVSRALIFNMTVPTTCLELNLKLWEIDKDKLTAETDLNAIKSPATQICNVHMNNDTKLIETICTERDTNLILSRPIQYKNLSNGAWSIIVVWKGLKQGDVCYITEFSRTLMLKQCSDQFIDIKQWRNYALIGRFHLTCYKEPGKTEDGWTLHQLALISVAVLLAVILLSWMYKFFRIRRGKSFIEDGKPPNPRSPVLAKKILIIYTKGPSSFMEEMKSFRDKLKERCGFPVHDLQSDEDNDSIVEFGPNEWIDRLLKHGCRVIWVDTPQFRLLVGNDKSYLEVDEDYAVDFRDTSIPFALATAKTLYIDPIMQYRNHFIVRWNGLEVTDGPDDPLAVISPHTRFRLPDHFDELCRDLELVEDRKTGVGKTCLLNGQASARLQTEEERTETSHLQAYLE